MTKEKMEKSLNRCRTQEGKERKLDKNGWTLLMRSSDWSMWTNGTETLELGSND